MTINNVDEAEGQIKEPAGDDGAQHDARLGDAVRRIKDAVDKLSDRIRLPNSGAKRSVAQGL
jgi:uncharacterized protein YjbJ (UPF0337 family)